VTKVSLIPVSDQTPKAGQTIGPGHYVQRSGLMTSGSCREQPQNASQYQLSTPPLAPGHIITNFHYELRGDNRCGAKWPRDTPSAMCELTTDRPDRKTVQFQLFPDRNNCFAYTAFQQDGSHHDNEASGTVTQDGAVTRSEM